MTSAFPLLPKAWREMEKGKSNSEDGELLLRGVMYAVLKVCPRPGTHHKVLETRTLCPGSPRHAVFQGKFRVWGHQTKPLCCSG